MTVEYFISLKNAKGIGQNIESFINILNGSDNISVKGNKAFLCKKGLPLVEFRIEIKKGYVLEKEYGFYFLKIDGEEDNLESFEDLCRNIRVIINRVFRDTVLMKTWDDIGTYYAKKAYPVIEEIENLMRNFISKFMFVFYGDDWFKKFNSVDFVSRISKKEAKNTLVDFIYKTDFIELTEEVLFKKYRERSLTQLDSLFEKSDDSIILKKDDIEQYVSRSNWDKYFNEVLPIKEEKLKKDWDKLYLYRNKVAHSRGLNKEEFQDLVTTSNELKTVLRKAIEEVEAFISDWSDFQDAYNDLESGLMKKNPLAAGLILLAVAFASKGEPGFTKKNRGQN